MDTRAGSTTEKTIDIDRIKQMIPHRYPFLMIDKVINVNPGVSAVGIKNVTINEPFFEGHFPSLPVMPGVLIVEAMAQTAAVLVMDTLGKETEGRLVYFMSIDSARRHCPHFRGKVPTTGQCMEIQERSARRRYAYGRGDILRHDHG